MLLESPRHSVELYVVCGRDDTAIFGSIQHKTPSAKTQGSKPIGSEKPNRWVLRPICFTDQRVFKTDTHRQTKRSGTEKSVSGHNWHRAALGAPLWDGIYLKYQCFSNINQTSMVSQQNIINSSTWKRKPSRNNLLSMKTSGKHQDINLLSIPLETKCQ